MTSDAEVKQPNAIHTPIHARTHITRANKVDVRVWMRYRVADSIGNNSMRMLCQAFANKYQQNIVHTPHTTAYSI